jgi:hypothetical protein
MLPHVRNDVAAIGRTTFRNIAAQTDYSVLQNTAVHIEIQNNRVSSLVFGRRFVYVGVSPLHTL